MTEAEPSGSIVTEAVHLPTHPTIMETGVFYILNLQLNCAGFEVITAGTVTFSLGRNAVYFGNNQTFQRFISPLSSGQKGKPSKKSVETVSLKMEVICSSEGWALSERHGVTTQNTALRG
jgi:hypothetical protein